MDISMVSPNIMDAVSVSAVEWGLIGRRLLSAMSGGEAPTRPWIEPLPTSHSPPTYDSKTPIENTEGREDVGAGEEGRERRKLKNEDSSYDSDFDPCESSTSPRPEDAHEDVSRTASETLAAEFEEYITHQPNQTSATLASRSAFTVVASSTSGTRTTIAQPNLISSTPVLTVTESSPLPVSASLSFPSVSAPASSTSASITPISSTHHSTTTSIPVSTITSKPTSTVVTTSTTSLSGAPLSVDDSSVVSLATVIESADYPQQVEFGVKLGYSESLVQLALTKLGVNPDKNELLDELIRLGAGAPRSDCEEELTEGEESEAPILRQIIIDGSNVAMSHGNKVKFSCKGIRLCVDWFRSRGHKEIVVFVPMWRKEPSRLDSIITDQDLLKELEKEGVLSFTPSRSCGGKRIVSYDDRYIIKEALKSEGVIVSNDNYRDLVNESPAFRRVIETSLLMFSWVNGRFEPPDDPLGRNGPSLDVFLRKPLLGSGTSVSAKDSRPCPYGRKCTYGNKCKYMHPERGAAPIKTVTEMLQEQKQKHYQDKAKSRDSSPGEGLRVKSVPFLVTTSEPTGTKKPLARTQSTIPTVSHSQTASTRENSITELSSSVTTSDTCSGMHAPVSSQGSLDSLCGPLMKGDTSSSLFTLCSPHRPQLSYGSPWQSQDLSQARMSLPLNKQPPEHENTNAENLHPKLQRQLSINPVNDDRLSKMSKQYVGHSPSGDYANIMSSLSLQQQHQQINLHQQLMHQQQQQQQQQQPQQHRHLENEALVNRSCINTRCISPGPVFSHCYGNREMMQPFLHPPLTRHSSSQENKVLSSYSQHMLPPCFHVPVGRNLSAPDQIRGGGQQQQQTIIPHITRLNSTSDSRLNMHGSGGDTQQFLSDCFEESLPRHPHYSHLPLSAVSSTSSGPIGSRPMSPQQPLATMLSSSRVPQPGSMNLSLKLSSGSNTYEDERLKIFYHLSQLFPEAQVRGALARNPDETDPTKICMSILALSGCRPVSPQQMGGAGITHPNLGGNLSLRSSSFGSSFPTSTSHDTAREAARMEAYSSLSKLFPEEQVRNVLLRYPEETDPTKLCMLLMSTNSSQS